MSSNNTKKVTLYGLMIAMVFVTTYFTKIQGISPQGYVNFGDILIMVSAILIGKRGGFVAGAFGSALADILSGYLLYAPVTFVVKGLEGYIVGAIASNSEGKGTVSYVRIIVAVTTGAVVMMGGYFLADLYVMRLFDSTFGYATAIGNLIPGNLIQGSISAVLGYVIVGLLNRVNIKRYIFR